MSKFQQMNLFGNVIDIKTAGKTKIIKLAQATFSDDKTKKSHIHSVFVFESQYKAIAGLEAQLAEVRATTGRENAAVQNVHVTARVKSRIRPNAEGVNITTYQASLAYLGKKTPKATVAKTEAPVADAKAEVKAEAQEAPVANTTVSPF